MKKTGFVKPIVYIAFFSLALTGCAKAPPPQHLVGYGTIKQAKLLAKTPGQLKTYATRDAAVGAVSGAAVGLGLGVAGGMMSGAMAGGVIGSMWGFLIPGIGPAIVVGSLAVGAGVGLAVGDIVGASKKVFKKGYIFCRYLVKVDGAKPYTVRAFQFSKFKYPVGSDVKVYDVKGKNNHNFYVIKLLAGYDNSQQG